MNWKKVIGWTAVAILSLILLVVIVGLVVLSTPQFHNYVLATLKQKVGDALNADVQVQGLNFNLHNLTVDLNGVTIRTQSMATEPLLTVDRIHADVNIVSALHRKWYVNDIEVEHPVLHIYVDKDGNNNLPKPKPSGGQSNVNLFDLGIRHALLSSGEVYYNDRKQLLNANLHDLTFKSVYHNTGAGSYSGDLSYRNGKVQYGHYDPLPHNLDASFEATPSEFSLSPAVLSVGDSRFELSAKLADYSTAPRLTATYNARVDVGEFRNALNNPSLPLGTVRLEGTAEYQSTPNNAEPLLDAIVAKGNISSPVLAVRNANMRGEIRDLRAGFRLANGNAALENVRANLLGGTLEANATIRNVSTTKQARVRATLHNVSLADATAMLSPKATANVKLTGTANATLEAAWHGSMQDLSVRSDDTLQASVAPAKSTNGVTVPVQGVLHADYSGRTKTITLTQSTLKTSQTTIYLNGTAGERSAMQIRMQANDLRELGRIVEAFQTPKAGQTSSPLNLAGTATFNGTLRGSTANPTLAGQLAAQNLQVKGSRWRSLRTNIQLSPSQASLRKGTLIPAGQGRITFDLSAGLQKWSYTSNNPITVAVNASNLQVGELTQLAGSQAPVSGVFNADVNVRGTQNNPVGQGKIALTNAKVYGEPVESAQVQFQGTGEVVHANLNVSMPAGNSEATIAYYPKTEGYDATLRALGIQLGKLKSQRLQSMKVAGVLNLTASGRGTVKNPELQASLLIPALSVKRQDIQNINLQATVQNHLANFTLNSDVVNTYVRAKGQVSLTDGYIADISLDTGGIPLQPLFAAYAPAQANLVSGETELHASMHGPLKNKSQLEAHVQIPTLRLNYGNSIQLAATAPIRADYRNGLLKLQPGEITGTGTDLRFQGDIPVTGNAPATVTMLGNLDLRLAKIFVPNVNSTGQVRFDIRSTGTLSNIKGQVWIENASVQTVGAPIGLQKANGLLTVTTDRVTISSFTGEVGGGTVTASGGVVYRPTLTFDLGLKASEIDFVYENQIRTALDASLAFIGDKSASTLSGRVTVDRVSFTPDFDLSGLFTSATGVSSPPAAGTFADRVKLDIAVQTAPSLNLVSQTLSIQGGANLHVQGTASQPVIVGRVNLNGGDVIFRGNRYVIDQGTIDFVNPNQIKPVVNVAISTVIDQYNINMRFQGPIERLNTVYTSDPALPPVDILHLLAFGNTTEASTAAGATPGTMGAESMLASGISGYGSGQLGKLAGLSYLSIDPVLGRTGQNPGARVEIQKRVTSNLYVTFASDVTSTQREEIQVQYQINPRWSVSANRDQNGGFGFDARVHKKF